MPSTAYVADSTLGLSPERALEQGIYLIPQQVVVEGKSYRDYLEMSPEAFAQAQLAGKKVGTSQISPSDVEATYQGLLERFDRIVSVHVSSKLSGTYSTARMVAAPFGQRIQVLDSLSLNGCMRFVIEETRQKLAAGVAWERLEEALAPMIAQLRGLVLPQTLKYLYQGGRIGGLQHFIGSWLKILPILEVKDGLVNPVAQVRGWHKGLARMAELLHKTYPGGAKVILAHAYNPDALEDLRKLIGLEGITIEDTHECGPAVAAHAGPGTVALFAAPRQGFTQSR